MDFSEIHTYIFHITRLSRDWTTIVNDRNNHCCAYAFVPPIGAFEAKIGALKTIPLQMILLLLTLREINSAKILLFKNSYRVTSHDFYSINILDNQFPHK